MNNKLLNESMTHLIKSQIALDKVNISEIILTSDLVQFELVREMLNNTENELQKLRRSLDCSDL